MCGASRRRCRRLLLKANHSRGRKWLYVIATSVQPKFVPCNHLATGNHLATARSTLYTSAERTAPLKFLRVYPESAAPILCCDFRITCHHSQKSAMPVGSRCADLLTSQHVLGVTPTFLLARPPKNFESFEELEVNYCDIQLDCENNTLTYGKPGSHPDDRYVVSLCRFFASSQERAQRSLFVSVDAAFRLVPHADVLFLAYFAQKHNKKIKAIYGILQMVDHESDSATS